MKNLILLFFLCLLISCKKNNSTAPANPPTPNTPVPAQSNLVYGRLETTKSYYQNGTTYTPHINYGVGCFFSSTGIYTQNPFDALPAGAIYLNAIRLKEFNGGNNFAYQYHDSTFEVKTTPFTWEVVGAGIIPGFTTTITDPFPAFNNFNQMPDSVSLSGGFSIPISTSGADSASVDLFLDSGGSGGFKTKTFAISAGSVGFSGQETNDFLSIDYSKYRSVRLSYIKYNVQTFGGKPFVFKTISSFIRSVKQVP